MVKVIQIGPMGFDNNYSYLVFGSNKHALLIDATGSKNAIEKEIRENDLTVVAQVVTHMHLDHIEFVSYFVEKKVPLIDFEKLKLEPGFMVDDFLVKIIFTPGHSKDSVCFSIENNLFSGDTLFAKGIGRVDFEGGSSEEMQKSLEKLSKLSKEIIVWPGHNYGGSKTTLEEALSFIDYSPSKDVLKKIDEKILDYEKKFKNDN
jgi:glyoxylase-like metal-dependent hydrolase (beta-lactamase superfamily II)